MIIVALILFSLVVVHTSEGDSCAFFGQLQSRSDREVLTRQLVYEVHHGIVPSILLINTQAVEEQVQELMFWEADLPSPENLKVYQHTPFCTN